MNEIFDIFTTPASQPFAIALTVVVALFVLELLSAILGGTILGAGSDGPDIDVDADFDLSVEMDGDFDLDLDADMDADLDAGIEGGATGGLFTWIGARDVPFLIWLVSFLTMFGLSGLLLQSLTVQIFGAPLPMSLAVLAAFVPALGATRIIANWVALLMPKTETTALKARHLGGYHGKVTQGTARRGKPAEVKITDRHGNVHYLRVEPLHDEAEFTQGSDVTLIRKRGDKFFVI